MQTPQNNHDFRSKQGQLVHVRQMAADDAPLLVDIFNHMSSDSRYKRFNQTLDSVVPNRVWEQALLIAQADPDKCQGLIALVDMPGQPAMPIGAVRFVETAPGEAEVAISLRDDFQNMGIGTQLMRLLALKARARGYRILTASIRNDNPAIWRVFSRLPFKVTRTPESSFSEVTIYLDMPQDPAHNAQKRAAATG